MHSSQRVCCSLTFQTVLDTFYIRSPQDHHCFRDFLKRFRQHNVFLVAKIKCNNTVRIQNCDQLQWHNRDTEISCTTMGYEEEKTESGGICMCVSSCFLIHGRGQRAHSSLSHKMASLICYVFIQGSPLETQQSKSWKLIT